MNSRPNISFFCPAYYDEKNIETVVAKAIDVLSRHAGKFEILIVDDGSPDATGEVADRLAQAHPEVKVIHHPENLGYGAALRTGFANAKLYEFVCFTDGDNQFDFNEIIKMLPLLDRFDVVTSYRTTKAYSNWRKFISFVYNLLVRVMFRSPFRDVSSSLKIFRREVIDAMRLRSTSPFIDAEILVNAVAMGYRVDEVAIFSYPRLHGRSSSVKLKNILATVRDMMATWLRLKASPPRRPAPKPVSGGVSG